MIREHFNMNWEVCPAGVMMVPDGSMPVPVPVTLPYDCMLDGMRDKNAPSKASSGYYMPTVKSYTKTFDVPTEWEDKYVVFDFEGVYMNAAVYINGDYAGGFPHGYTEFYVEANKFLKYGAKNKIVVNFSTAEDSRWYSGAGVYRNVNIMVSELVHIVPDSYRIATPEVDDEGARVTIDFSIANRGYKNVVTSVVTTIYDAEGNPVGENESRVTAFPQETEANRQSIYLDGIRRWSIDEPYLYTAKTKVMSGDKILDTEESEFGIRTLQLDPKHGLRINGEVVKLRGTCIHHDNGMLGSAAIDRAEERRAELLKKAGFNAVRSAHNPISKAFIRACDRIGVVIMDEVSDMWNKQKTPRDFAVHFPQYWEKMCESIVAKDFNHPSVIMYSIGNEIPDTGTAAGGAMSRKLVDKVRSLDSTRYILNSINVLLSIMDQLVEQMATSGEINGTMNDLGAAMEQISMSELATEATKESYDCLDICGYNYATGRYELDKKLNPNRVLVGSETSPKEIGANWEIIMKNPHAIGDFTWTGWDYLGEAGIGKMEYPEDGAKPGFAGEFPWLIAYCGDIDILGNRRPISYYREIVFGLTDTPYLAMQYPWNHGKNAYRGMWDFFDGIGSWSFKGYEGKPINVDVYGKGDSYKLFLNQEEIASGDLVLKKGNTDITYQPGELTVVTYENGQETGTYTVKTAGTQLQIKAEADKAVMKAGDSDLVYVDIAICDQEGIVDNMADCMLKASVTGPAELLAFGSAQPKTTESFKTGEHTTFDGKAMAIIRATGTGDITLTVESDKYAATKVSVTAE